MIFLIQFIIKFSNMVSIMYLPHNVVHLTLVHFSYLGLIILNTTKLILNNIIWKILIIQIQRAMGYIYDIYIGIMKPISQLTFHNVTTVIFSQMYLNII